jgi:hypothetical protein
MTAAFQLHAVSAVLVRIFAVIRDAMRRGALLR